MSLLRDCCPTWISSRTVLGFGSLSPSSSINFEVLASVIILEPQLWATQGRVVRPSALLSIGVMYALDYAKISETTPPWRRRHWHALAWRRASQTVRALARWERQGLSPQPNPVRNGFASALWAEWKHSYDLSRPLNERHAQEVSPNPREGAIPMAFERRSRVSQVMAGC